MQPNMNIWRYLRRKVAETETSYSLKPIAKTTVKYFHHKSLALFELFSYSPDLTPQSTCGKLFRLGLLDYSQSWSFKEAFLKKRKNS